MKCSTAVSRTLRTGLYVVAIAIAQAGEYKLSAAETTPDAPNRTSSSPQKTGEELIKERKAYTSNAKSRRALQQEFINAVYKPVLGVLGVSAEKEDMVMRLLQERMESLYDANDLLDERKELNPGTRNAAELGATRGLDAQFKAILDDNAYQKLQDMIAAEWGLDQVANGYAEACRLQGVPLTPAQRFRLATALRQYDAKVNVLAAKRLQLPVKANGLSELDEQVMALIAEELSIDQRAVVLNNLVVTNRSIAKATRK